MEEELQKRNTDCVYFLASPLTCKKGSECEYRHSEMARLNPRDCWYWLSGNCLNGSCAFRHPPLDGRPETPTEPAPNQPNQPNHQSAVSVNKTNVPCYYFYNGFCNKGEKCTFQHGPVNSMPTWKSSNTGSVNPNGPSMEKKASAGSDTGSAPVVTNANSFPGGHQQGVASRREPDPEIHQSGTYNAEKQNESPLTPESPFDDVAAGRSNSALVAAGSFQRRSHTSSPGFDVLVDDGSEELGHEEDYEYVLDDDREGREFNGHRYDYDENAEETDPAYAGLSTLYKKEGRDYEDRIGAAHNVDFVRKGAAYSRGSVLDRIEPRKRNFLPRELANNSQDGLDLRHLLKRRKMVDDHSRNYSSRRLESSRLVSQGRERPRSPGERQLHGRRASEINNGFSRSRVEDERPRRTHFDRSRLQEKAQLPLSEVPGKAAPRYMSYADDTTIFTGPKTLSQLKEEKRARGNREPSESTLEDEIVQEDFERPKTLDEILEEKKRLRSQVDGNNDIN